MTESLTLLGQRNVFSPKGRDRFHGDLIIGIEQENGRMVQASEKDSRFPNLYDKPVKRIPLTLGKYAASRLVEFYERAYSEHETPDYDCTGFAVYLSGIEDDVQLGRNIRGKYFVGEQVHPNDLEEAVLYSITGQDGTNVHTLLGGPRPVTNISVLGRQSDGGGLLVHTANPVIMQVYYGDSISRVITTDGIAIDAKN